MGSSGDARFAALSRDPKYRLPSAKNGRVQVDKRFSRMFNDKDFNKKAKVDRYGRKLPKDNDSKVLQRLYRTDDERAQSTASTKDVARSSSDDSDEADPDDQVQAELARVNGQRDYAREGFDSSSDDDDDSSSDDDEEDDDDDDTADVVEAELPEQQSDAQVPMGDPSARLAIVNLDWDNIRAVDILAVAQSFTPSGTGITDVRVYPSEFGKERIEREALDGPPREIFAAASSSRQHAKTAAPSNSDDDSADEDARIKDKLLQADDGQEFDSAHLRAYQLQRLRYYYAVVTCDSTATAQALYDAMDGREYLSTANFFDMRFIPDHVAFDEQTARDECTTLPTGYKPNDFVTDALTHSKVKLTWDNDDTTRKEIQKRAFSRAQIDENDIQAYVGGSSSSSEDDDDDAGGEQSHKQSKAEAQRIKMRKALGLSDEPTASASASAKSAQSAPAGDMQITFTSGLSSSTATKAGGGGGGTSSVFQNEPIKDETTIEKYVRREKERKARRREKAKAARNGGSSSGGGLLADEVAAGPKDEPTAEEVEEEQGFNDPFFADDATTSFAADRARRKAERTRLRAEQKQAETLSTTERAKLEALLTSQDKQDGLKHFDMNEIVRAEKAESKGVLLLRGKNGRRKSRRVDLNEDAPGRQVGQGDFAVETADPRFAGLFSSHEFAIDPSNPRFTKTKGMQALLEEGRRKRKGGDDAEAGAQEGTARVAAEKPGRKKRRRADEVDVKGLVAKVKNRG